MESKGPKDDGDLTFMVKSDLSHEKFSFSAQRDNRAFAELLIRQLKLDCKLIVPSKSRVALVAPGNFRLFLGPVAGSRDELVKALQELSLQPESARPPMVVGILGPIGHCSLSDVQEIVSKICPSARVTEGRHKHEGCTPLHVRISCPSRDASKLLNLPPFPGTPMKPSFRRSVSPTNHCRNCFKLDHITSVCPNDQLCGRCAQPGHVSAQCQKDPLCSLCDEPHPSFRCSKIRPSLVAVTPANVALSSRRLATAIAKSPPAAPAAAPAPAAAVLAPAKPVWARAAQLEEQLVSMQLRLDQALERERAALEQASLLKAQAAQAHTDLQLLSTSLLSFLKSQFQPDTSAGRRTRSRMLRIRSLAQ